MFTSYVLWLAIGLLILIVEIFLGTVFFLALALSAFIAALVAFLDFSLTHQLVVAAITIVVGCVGIWRWRARSATRQNESDRLMKLDVAQSVEVTTVDAMGQASVQYRGAPWTACLDTGEPLTPGRYRIVKVDGPRLVLTREASTPSKSILS